MAQFAELQGCNTALHPCCPHPHGIHIPLVSPSMWHLHTPALFWGAGVSPGLWVIPGHPTVHRGCVPWAQAVAQVWGLL